MRKFQRIKHPERAIPLVKQLVELMNTEQLGTNDMCERAGINRKTFDNWRIRRSPNVSAFEACLNVLGYKLVIKPME